MHTDTHRFYAVLGVDPAASDKAIRVAFRRRAKQLHPDAPEGDAGAFILLKRAYDTLSDPAQRANYDRACQPAPADAPHRFTAPPFVPRPPLRQPRRREGAGLGRYVIAFVVMAAISLGAIQAMISLTEAPPSIRTRDVPQAAASSAVPEPIAEAPAAPGSSKSGFWDASPPQPSKK